MEKHMNLILQVPLGDSANWKFMVAWIVLLPFATLLKTFVFSEEHLNSVVKDLAQYDADMGCKAMVNIEPPSVDQRIINQYSFFSVVPSGITCVDDFLERYTKNTVRYIIKKELRWDARDLLDQYNVNERMVYPGLDGLTKWLARHYYVKR